MKYRMITLGAMAMALCLANINAFAAETTYDRKTCKMQDLKVGMKVRVTSQQGKEKVASIIEAIKSNLTFANTHYGKLVSISGNTFVMTNENGKKHSHTIMTNAKVTCDGKSCNMEDLKAGMKIRVSTRKSNQTTVIKIEALDQNQNTEFV